MIVNGGDISKINPEIVAKVERVEQEEGYIATITLQKIEPNIFMCNVVFAKPGTNQIAFTSLNLYEECSNEIVTNMQDGIVSGFEITCDAFEDNFPTCPEDVANRALHELFVMGCD